MGLELLIGLELTCVRFAVDHLQLDFDRVSLTCHAWPQVDTGSDVKVFGDEGYRDDLCLLLGSAVRDTRESFLQGLVIDLGVGRLVVDPEPEELAGPAVATLTTPDRTVAWTVTAPPFDGRTW